MEFDRPEMAQGLYPYLLQLVGSENGVMAAMEEYARRRRFPIIGPLVGRFLLQLAIILGARRVLEIGSGFGYSAAWFFRAHSELTVVCTDSSELNRERCLEFLTKLEFEKRVDFRVGDALENAVKAEGSFDIIFLDIDKSRYAEAFKRTLSKLRLGGLFIADNALWRGYAFVDAAQDTPEFRKRMIQGVREFNKVTHETTGVLTTLLPLRDGVSVSLKLSEDVRV